MTSVRKHIRNAVKKLLYPGKERNTVVSRDQFCFPGGHFYSPIPSIKDVKLREEEIFGDIPKSIPGIDLNEARQLELLREFMSYYKDIPFETGKKKNVRFYLENPCYSHSDAIILYCMLRHLRPK